jgi:Flp pilus assembly protein TadD
MFNRELAISGQYQGAAVLASHALVTSPSHGGLLLVLSVASLHLGHWFQAIECCSRALQVAALDPLTKSQLVAVRGVALIRSGRQSEGRSEIVASGICNFHTDPLLNTLAKDFED